MHGQPNIKICRTKPKFVSRSVYISSEQPLWLSKSGIFATTVVTQIVNKLPVLDGTSEFITLFKRHDHWKIFSARYIQLTSTNIHARTHTHTNHLILRNILILSPTSPKWSFLFRFFFSTSRVKLPLIFAYVWAERPWTGAGAYSGDVMCNLYDQTVYGYTRTCFRRKHINPYPANVENIVSS